MILESVRGHKDGQSDDGGARSIAGGDSDRGSNESDESVSQRTPQMADHRAAAQAASRITTSELLIQGIATSIDALSVGLTLADYGWKAALLSAAIIAAVTYAICMGGLLIGKKIGSRLSSRAEILGGAVLIFIGFEILIRSFLP